MRTSMLTTPFAANRFSDPAHTVWRARLRLTARTGFASIGYWFAGLDIDDRVFRPDASIAGSSADVRRLAFAAPIGWSLANE